MEIEKKTKQTNNNSRVKANVSDDFNKGGKKGLAVTVGCYFMERVKGKMQN